MDNHTELVQRRNNIRTSATENSWRVLTIWHALQTDTEALICFSDNLCTEVCYVGSPHLWHQEKAMVFDKARQLCAFTHSCWVTGSFNISLKEVEMIRSVSNVFLSSLLEAGTWEEVELDSWTIGFVDYMLLRALDSVFLDRYLKNLPCWHWARHNWPGEARTFWAASWLEWSAEI